MSTLLKADATGAMTLPAELCRAAGVAPGGELTAEVQGEILTNDGHFSQEGFTVLFP